MSKSYQPKSPAWSSGAHRAQYVIPYGIGGNPFGVDVFGSAMQLFDKIAARVFGPWRLPVLQPPTTARCLWTYVRDRVPLRRRAILRVGIRTSNDRAHSPEWRRDPSADRNPGALDLVILDDRARRAEWRRARQKMQIYPARAVSGPRRRGPRDPAADGSL